MNNTLKKTHKVKLNTQSSLETHINSMFIILEKVLQFSFDSKTLLCLDNHSHFNIVDRNHFLSRTRTLFWIISVIELAKLFGSKNDDYRLSFLLEEMIQSYNDADWKNKITISELNLLNESLKHEQVINAIAELKKMRDQYYAHSDAMPLTCLYKIQFTYTEIETLADVAKNILSLICSKIFDKQLLFGAYDTTSVSTLLNKLEKASNK